VNRYFAPIRTAGQATRASGDLPRLDREVHLVVAARVELPMISIVWPTPPDHAPDDAGLDVVAQLLTGDRAGWLRWKLVDELKIAAHVWSVQSSHRLASEFSIDATATKGHTPRELLDAIDAILAGLQAGPVDAYSASGSVTGFLLPSLFGLEQTTYRAQRYGECEQFGTREGCITRWISRYSKVTAAEMTEVAKRQLPLTHRVVAEVYPADDAPIAGELRDVPPGGSR
jgi:predicted Zn-dependent peptidase